MNPTYSAKPLTGLLRGRILVSGWGDMGQRNPLVTLAATGVGLLVVKMLTLTRADAPRWLLPVAGGAVFTGRVGLWLTSSLWFFTTFGIIR